MKCWHATQLNHKIGYILYVYDLNREKKRIGVSENFIYIYKQYEKDGKFTFFAF